MTTQHTPGPWSVDGSNIRGPDRHNVAIVSGLNTVGVSDEALEARAAERERDYANARLIAEAPAMLEALKDATSMLLAQFRSGRLIGLNDGTMQRNIDTARAIIARIEGKE